MAENNLFDQSQFTDPQAGEPEVILQEIGFADYGFGEGDSISAGHDFGGFMDDDNKDSDTLDGFNAFNSQTPNFDPAAVEAASKAATAEEKAMFTSTTPNLDLAAVEAASKVSSDSDRDIFSNSFAVGAVEQTVSETPAFDAATASFNKPVEATPEVNPVPPTFEAAPAAPAAPSFLASMQSMFTSMNGTAAPAAPVPDQSTPRSEQPIEVAVEESPVEEAPAEPEVEETPIFKVEIPEEVIEEPSVEPVAPGKIDIVITEASAPAPIQDITSQTPPEEKDQDYWDNINKMLEGFEEKPKEAPAAETKQAFAAPVMPGAPAFNAPAETESENSEDTQKEEKRPFSEGAQVNSVSATPAVNIAPVAPVTPVAPTPAPNYADAPKPAYAPAPVIPVVEEEKEEETEESEAKSEKSKKSKGFVYNTLPNKDDSVLEIVRKVVAIISAVALLVCGVYFLCTFIGSKSHSNDASKLADIMSSSESSDAAWEDIRAKYPDINFPTGMQAKFADIYAMNTDLVGWIRIPGLGIDYPVVQTTDDSYYLKHDFNKQSSAYGTIFLSAGNGYKDGLDLNTVIYGHAMRRDKQMFSRLHDYKDSKAFIENPIIEFNTLYENYKFKVYCAFIANGSSAQDNGYLLDYTFTELSSTESFAGFVAEINQRKLYSTGTDILPTDKIITLSTCSYEFDNARLVVVGRLLRKGESEEIDASKVKDSDNPRYPQAWYDANKKTNPYASYSHWKPQ